MRTWLGLWWLPRLHLLDVRRRLRLDLAMRSCRAGLFRRFCGHWKTAGHRLRRLRLRFWAQRSWPGLPSRLQHFCCSGLSGDYGFICRTRAPHSMAAA